MKKARILATWTHCDADCDAEVGYHSPAYTTCGRCGARVHVRVYEVETPTGEVLRIGIECLKDILGYTPGPWHQKAAAVAALLAATAKPQEGAVIRPETGKRALVGGHRTRLVHVPHNLTATLLRAGADLGCWTYPEDPLARFGGQKHLQVKWIGFKEADVPWMTA